VSTHRCIVGDARRLPLPDASVALVVTSPPYPMITMWDEAFAAMDPAIAGWLTRDPSAAFEAQHRVLDAVWAECARVLVPGGFVCINVGDATRSLAGEFRLWPNHARITMACARLGLTVLPDILWRKPTNAPNKFMGSGMLPAGAYVTYEHEYVLVLRKGPGRVFRTAEDRERRRASAFFWEERNLWFSDLWTDLAGTSQVLRGGARERSGAFPLDLPARLVAMYSLRGDTVLDPFAGTGTTLLAAACAERDSVGVEVVPELAEATLATVEGALRVGPARARARLSAHASFVAARRAAGKALGYHNAPHDVAVMTSQETGLTLTEPVAVRREGDAVVVEHGVVGDGRRTPDTL
jgi:DNA modification methylase